MSEMIDRIARAMRDHPDTTNQLIQGEAEHLARVAIEVMRNPGHDFIWNAVHDREPMLNCIRGHDLSGDEAEAVYQAVIDAILDKQPA